MGLSSHTAMRQAIRLSSFLCVLYASLQPRLSRWRQKLFLCHVNPEIIHVCLISVLGCQAGIGQVPLLIVPLLQAAVIKQLQIILNHKRNNTIVQALLKHYQPAYTAVAVRMWFTSQGFFHPLQIRSYR